MAQALTTVFDNPLPAHIAALMNEEGAGNIVARASVNALTFEGKVWSINMDGKKTKLMRTNADGEDEPVSIFTSIVLDYAKDRGREWYGKAYDPKNPTIPDCWSEDSKVPHPNCQTPVAKTCAICPNAKKGSAQTSDGNPTVACGQFQKLAVIPAAKIGQFPPLRLRLKITSIYDKSGIDKHPGWHAWQQYIEHLVSKGINVTYALPTKMKFDTTAYPKLLFSPGKDWLDADTAAIVRAMAQSDEVKDLFAQTYDPSTSNTGNKPLPADEDEEELPAAAMPVQARAAKPAAPKAAPAPADDEDEVNAAAAAQATAARAAKAGKAAPVKAAPAPADDDEDDAPAAPAPADDDEDDAPAAPAPAPKPRTATATATATNASAAVKAVQKAAAAKAAAPAPADDDEDDTTAMPPAKPAKAAAPVKANGKAATAAAPAPKGTLQAPAEVADLMGEWDD